MAGEKIPYEMILAAKQGDPEAMDAILRYFDRYIEANSYHPSIEGFPGSGGGLNVDIKAQIQDKLTHQIIYDFDPARLRLGRFWSWNNTVSTPRPGEGHPRRAGIGLLKCVSILDTFRQRRRPAQARLGQRACAGW